MRLYKPTLQFASRMMMSAGLCISLGLFASAQASVTAQASAQTSATSSPAVNDHAGVISQTFAPQRDGLLKSRLDYLAYDFILQKTVVHFGPSARNREKRPDPYLGTRIVTGHKTAYRTEGSRFRFYNVTPEIRSEIGLYRKDLEAVGNRIDLTRLARDEQLAFWLNLHNVTMVEHISKHYPVKRPSKIKIDGVPLNEAKILNIREQALSLRDIREKIVYTHWRNPNVIYGFFHGDIGSPALETLAYTRDNVWGLLKGSGEEFANSLRGFNRYAGARRVSHHYFDAAPYYFPDLERDLTPHLLGLARADVGEDILKGGPYERDQYDAVVADLVGGSRPRTPTKNVTVGGVSTDLILLQGGSIESQRLLEEVQEKIQKVRRRGWIATGTVTIEDIETESEVYDPNVDPESATYVPPKAEPPVAREGEP